MITESSTGRWRLQGDVVLRRNNTVGAVGAWQRICIEKLKSARVANSAVSIDGNRVIVRIKKFCLWDNNPRLNPREVDIDANSIPFVCDLSNSKHTNQMTRVVRQSYRQNFEAVSGGTFSANCVATETDQTAIAFDCTVRSVHQ